MKIKVSEKTGPITLSTLPVVDKVTAFPRVTNINIKPFEYNRYPGESISGEATEIRASGTWMDERNQLYPISLHITVPPGCAITPVFGDCFKVTIECERPEDRSGSCESPQKQLD